MNHSKLGRRDFLKTVGLAAPLILAAPAAVVAEETNSAPAQTASLRAKEIAADLVIIGGGLGGCAAVLEAPRPDGGTGWKGLRLRPDVVGTVDGLAKYPHIREGRRLKADFTVLEQHVTTEARMKETGLSKEAVRAAKFADSVGIGSYQMDLHITTTGDHGTYGSTLPFQIPLGALIPRRVQKSRRDASDQWLLSPVSGGMECG